MDLKIYRTNSVLGISQWDDKRRVMLELSPSKDGAGKGQPKAGEQRFDYDKAIRISFTVKDMLTASYTLIGMSQGVEELSYQKFADMSKSSSASGDEKKSLKISGGDKGGFFVGLMSGPEKVNITLNADELYALGKYLEFSAQKYISMPNDFQVAEEA